MYNPKSEAPTVCRPKTSYTPVTPLHPPSVYTVSKQYTYCESDVIGEGLSSKVYVGTCNVTRKAVSVKVIRKQHLQQKNIVSLVRDEVKLLSKLKHENVVALEAFEENERVLSIVTQYCNGGDLEQLLKKKGKLPEYQALAILEDIIRGYNHLVSNNIVHRDIKPANIFLSNGRAKIADFGFAMLKNDVFAKNQSVGSPHYMPIESLDKNEFTHKSDIFAIGVVFYEMLHGTMPWEATSQPELIYKLRYIPYKVNEALSEKSKAFLKAALERNVEKRMDQKELANFFRNERSKQLRFKEQNALGLTPTKDMKEPDNLKASFKELKKPIPFEPTHKRHQSSFTDRHARNTQNDILKMLPQTKTTKFAKPVNTSMFSK